MKCFIISPIGAPDSAVQSKLEEGRVQAQEYAAVVAKKVKEGKTVSAYAAVYSRSGKLLKAELAFPPPPAASK